MPSDAAWSADEIREELPQELRNWLGYTLRPEIAAKCRTVGDAIRKLQQYLPIMPLAQYPPSGPLSPGIDTETVAELKSDLERTISGIALYRHLKDDDEFTRRFLPNAVAETLRRAQAIRERQPKSPRLPTLSGNPDNNLTLLLDWCTSAGAKGPKHKRKRVPVKTLAAIELRTQHPDWTDKRIAEAAGMRPESLSRSRRYRETKTLIMGDRRARRAGDDLTTGKLPTGGGRRKSRPITPDRDTGD